MIEYKNRTYREHLQKERWYSFTVAYKETDLWIGIDQASFLRGTTGSPNHFSRDV
mgnify:CR=1 FL=1